MRCDAAHRVLTSMKGRTLTLNGSSDVGPSERMPRPSVRSDAWRSRFGVTPAFAASTTVKGRCWSSFGSWRAVFIAPSDQNGAGAAEVIHKPHRLLRNGPFGP